MKSPKQLANMLVNALQDIRSQMGNSLGLSHNGKRSLYSIYGYDSSLSSVNGFNRMYQYSRREGIANRVTWGMAKSCWRDGFEIYESAEDDAKKVLEKELLALAKSGLQRKIEQADILNRIGRFSVLYVGVPDGKEPHEELGKVFGDGDKLLDQLFFTPYAYDGVEIAQQETDPTNRRYGLPKMYTLQRMHRGDNEKDTELKSVKVHWSRIIHLNENALDSDIEGMGALEPIFNRIIDIDKATGGASEAYFRNARRLIAYEIDEKFAASMLQTPELKAAFKENAEKFTNEQQDHIMAAGSTAKSLATDHYSPLDTIKIALWAISAYTGIPLRVLTGEGAGQLAGSEDQLAYNQLVMDRRRLVCTPWLVRLFEILTQAGMLKSLPDGYEIRYPEQEPATAMQKAETGSKRADTVLKLSQAASQPGGDGIDLESAFAECGLEDIDVENVELDDDVDDELGGDPKPEPVEA